MAQTRSARETAYQLLRSRILNLDLKPNENLSDKGLALEMGMSRTPIREAILTLSLANLVVVRPQSGTFVAPIDLEMVEMEQFNRFVLEKELIVRAIPRLTEEAQRQYRENLELYQFYYHSHSPDREAKLFELDNAFHRITFQLGEKGRHFDWMLNSQHHIERVRILSSLMNLNNAVIDDHTKLLEAMTAGDAAGAIQILESHLTLYQAHLREMLKVYPHYFRGAEL